MVTDARNSSTMIHTDVWGRTVEVKPPLDTSTGLSAGLWTRYTYDTANQLVQVEQMSGSTPLTGFTTTLAYDQAGRKTSMTDPDMGVWQYTNDALGQLKTQTDARGCVITFT